MEYLAKAIVDCVSLFKELIMVWEHGQGNVPAQVHVGDSVASIFTNSVNFIASLTAEIMRQISNTAS